MKYKATLKIMGKEYKSTGNSIIDCLNELNPGFCKAKSVLIVEKGDNKRERVLGSLVTSRLFGQSSDIREIQTKQTAKLFE